MRWWVVTFLAGTILLGSAAGFFWLRRPVRPPASPAPRERCPNLDAELPKLPVEAPQTALWFEGPTAVRLSLDSGKVERGPAAVAPGVHRFRAEADGQEPLELKLVLEPSTPVLLQVSLEPGQGLAFALLGAGCASCLPPGEKPGFAFTRTSDSDQTLLAEAARSLRGGDWRSAAGRLRGVSPKSRGQAPFVRMQSTTLQLSGEVAAAEAGLARLPADPTLAAWSERTRADAKHAKAQPMRRWNLLTEKFSALLEKFALEAPGPVQVATSRLAELSEGFLDATQKEDLAGQEETVKAAEASLVQFVRALRRSRPEDCEFQARISLSL